MKIFLRRHRTTILLILVLFFATALIEWRMGRLPLGPDGKLGFWEGNIWSAENSQRLLDPYSFSHFIHGILFYAIFYLVARNISVEKRLVGSVLVEMAWELLENSPIIINRYREATIAIGYSGDSILNSLSDIAMVILGFWFAARLRPWISVVTVLVLEIGCLFWIRDNLTLNILMLIHPFEAIKVWQAAGHPV